MNPLAFIDLSARQVVVKPIPEKLRRLYLGGRGINMYLLYNELCGGDPQCVIYCATGAIKYADAESEAGEKRLRNIASLNLPSHPVE